MERDFTKGSVLKNILIFSLPYLLSYFLQTLYGMADLLIIGQFEGVASTTAVSVGSQVMHMLTVMIVGLAMGTTVCIGQSVGAKDKERISGYVGNSATMFLVLSVVLAVVLVVLVRPIVHLVSTPAEAVDGTVQYLTICFIGIPFITTYNIICSIFRGMGDSKSPMYFIAIACVANIGLDYLFMGVLHLGPAGAALGTTLAQTISVVIALTVILKKKMGLSIRGAHFIPQKEIISGILKIGMPICVQDGLIQVAFMIITILANRRGLTDAAAVGIVEKIISFLFLVPSSMLSTVSALGAQNIGAKQPERAKETLRYAILLAAGFGLVIGLLVQVTADPVVGLFTPDQAVIAAGGQYFRGYIWDCMFAGIHFSFSGYFCACGKSGLSFLHNIIAISLVRIPGVYLTSRLFPATLFPMGLATATGSLLSVIICVIAFTILNRKKQTV
ncbi:MAG: MATE family efflux transporter [Cuneatibacter sp.]|nr:MATE family efflux transporter [Cuneatibacter sp.]